MLSFVCGYNCFASTSQVIGEEDWFFAPVQWLAGMIVSKMTSNVLSQR